VLLFDYSNTGVTALMQISDNENDENKNNNNMTTYVYYYTVILSCFEKRF